MVGAVEEQPAKVSSEFSSRRGQRRRQLLMRCVPPVALGFCAIQLALELADMFAKVRQRSGELDCSRVRRSQSASLSRTPPSLIRPASAPARLLQPLLFPPIQRHENLPRSPVPRPSRRAIARPRAQLTHPGLLVRSPAQRPAAIGARHPIPRCDDRACRAIRLLLSAP